MINIHVQHNIIRKKRNSKEFIFRFFFLNPLCVSMWFIFFIFMANFFCIWNLYDDFYSCLFSFIIMWWWWWLGGGRNSKFYMMFKPNKCRFWNEIQIKIESEKKWKLTTTRRLYQWNLCVCEFKTASRMSKMKKEKKFDNRY